MAAWRAIKEIFQSSDDMEPLKIFLTKEMVKGGEKTSFIHGLSFIVMSTKQFESSVKLIVGANVLKI